MRLAERIRSIAWDHLGLLREAKGMEEATGSLSEIAKEAGQGRVTRAGVEARNLREVASLTAAAGLHREESRGAHYRTDRPQRDDERFGRSFARRCDGGERQIPVSPCSGRDGS